MNRQTEPAARDDRRQRLPGVVLTIIFAVLLLIDLFRWTQGVGGADGILSPAAFLLMCLGYVLQLKGMAQRVMLMLVGVLVVLRVVLMIVR